MPKTASFGSVTDYDAERADIERRRALAQALEQQGMQGIGPTESVGGWAIKKSPFEALGKVGQQVSGAYQQKRLTEEEKALATKQQSDLATALRASSAADIGTPGEARQGPLRDDEGNEMPGVAARAGNRGEGTNILMASQHPLAQQLGAQRYQQDAQRQALVAALTGQGMPGQPAQPGAPTQAGGAQMGGPAGGVPMAVWLQIDPSGKSYAEQLAKDNAASKTLTRVAPGGFAVNQSGQSVFAAPTNEGAITNFGANGPVRSLVPGALDTSTALQANKMPFSMQQMKVPVYLPGGDQIEVTMNATQARQYQTTGQLPPEVAASIPGLQQPQGQPQPQPGTPVGPPQGAQFLQNAPGGQPGGMRTQGAMRSAVADLPINPPGEPAMGADPRNIDASGQLIQPRGRPVVGRGQSQGEGVTQKRQQAGGNTTDETYAKDYVAFMNGGASDAQKQLSQLQDVVTQLSDPKAKLSGPFIGSTPDALLKFSKTGQNSIAMRERVEEVAQRSLRAILGSQFTEKEGERIIARSYNPNLPESENAIRVGRLFTQLQQSLAAKQAAAQYFQKNNTLEGWNGKLPSIGDFEPAPARQQIIPPEGMSAQSDRRATPRNASNRVVVDY